jgi:solute carrier family 25 protein 39/40
MEKTLETTPTQQMVASCSGAVITSLFMTPLDVVKVRLQAQKQGPLKAGRCFIYGNGLMDHLCTSVHPFDKCPMADRDVPWYNRPGKFNGTMDALVKIARREGIHSLWSGLPPTMIMAVPATVCYFTMYDQLYTKFMRRFGTTTSKANRVVTIPMVSGTLARVAASTLISPLEMFRTKMQSERIGYLQVFKAVRISLSQDGWLTLWRGLAPTLWRDVPFSAIYWSAYEFWKGFWLHRLQRKETTFKISFFCGFVGGALAAVVTCPFDVIKTHRQIEVGEQMAAGITGQKTSTFVLLKRLHQQQGVRGLFAGLVPRLIKVAPACAIMIGSYEYGKAFFVHRNALKQAAISDLAIGQALKLASD